MGVEIDANDPADAGVGVDDAYRLHRDRLTGLARLLTGSRETAEDVVHDAFAAAHARWASVDDPGGYLTRSVINRCRDLQRRRVRWDRLVWGRQPVTGIREIDDTWHQIARLPQRQRQIVVLRYYADMSFEEIATMLKRPASTIRSDHRRALDRLRRYL